MVFVDDLHRHEALAGIGQRDGNGSGIEVKHRGRIERVAVHADDHLLIDLSRAADVQELAKADFFHGLAHVEVRLGTGEILDRDRNGRRLRMRAAGYDQR